MIISQEFKNLYKLMIDEILSGHGLTNLCTLTFDNGSADLCNNCYYDMITKTSSNRYNGTGPEPFLDFTICPVCMGMGSKENNNRIKEVYLAVLFDSKYFLNLNSKIVNIPDGTIQTICNRTLILDIRNASSMRVNSVPNISYERIEDVNPAGLGDLDYIFATWRRQ